MRYGDDGTAYGGTHSGEQVFIVGKGTERERVFTKDDLRGASHWARRWRLAILHQTAGDLPNQAMRDLFEEAPG